MSTNLKLAQTPENTSTLIKMAIEFMDLIYYYNEAESEVEQAAVEKELNQLLHSAGRKFDNAVYVIRQLQSQADYFKELANSMTSKSKTAQNAIDRVKSYLIEVGKVNPQMLKGEVFKGNLYSRESVGEVDLEMLPDNYKIERIEIRPDKNQILLDKKNGITIPGVVLIRKDCLRIS